MNIPDLNFILILTESSVKNQKSPRDFQTISKMFSQIMSSTSSHGASMGLNAIQFGLGHVSMAAAPMIAIGKVGNSMNTTYELHDLLASSNKHCCCGKCAQILQFVINKRDKKSVKTAISSSVVGAPFVAVHGIIRNSYKIIKGIKGQERETYAKQLLSSAKPTGAVKQTVTKGKKISMDINIHDIGCPIAQATIAVLLKEPKNKEYASPMSYPKTISAISSPDNAWVALKQAMN